MASRLFRAIVGVGISLGATSAACFGEDTESANAADAGTQADASHAAHTDDGGHVGHDGATDSHVGHDAALQDAGADVVVTDAIADAFCDAPWPTTKGNTGPVCYPKLDDHNCGSSAGDPATCAGSTWACPSDKLYMMECWCWGPAPQGHACTDAGFVPLDAGPG